MSKIVLIAGYTKQSYLSKIRARFNTSDITLACVFTRNATTDGKSNYLASFDDCYNLTTQADRDRLKNDSPHILLVTCTEERDMVAYIEAQLLCGIITTKQANAYYTAIDKELCKKSIEKVYPQLVPTLHVVTDELLENLDMLTYPLVIKPTGLAGSTLIKIVNSPAEFRSHYQTYSQAMMNIAAEVYQKEIRIIAESYISGPQYSMNAYVNAEGTITFCPVVRVITPHELRENDTYSALQYTTDELTTDQNDTLENAIELLVRHFNIKKTSVHFDCVLHNGQWKFFEMGLRIGGHRQKLFELSHEFDHIGNDILNRLGMALSIPAKVRTACIVQKASNQHGILKQIRYQRTITEDKNPLIKEDKIRKIGKETGPVSEGGGTSIRFLVSGKDQERVVAESKKLFDSVIFEVEN